MCRGRWSNDLGDSEYEVYDHNTFVCVGKRATSSRRSRSCGPRLSVGTVHQPTPNVFRFLADRVQRPSVDGMTLMLRDVPFKMPATEFVGLLSELNAMDVEYAYLPQVTWSLRSGANANKGFAFVHFKHISSAQAFARSVGEFRHPMRTADAKIQGVGMNIRALLEMQDIKGRTEKIVFHSRFKDKFYSVFMHELRSYLTRHT